MQRWLLSRAFPQPWNSPCYEQATLFTYTKGSTKKENTSPVTTVCYALSLSTYNNPMKLVLSSFYIKEICSEMLSDLSKVTLREKDTEIWTESSWHQSPYATRDSKNGILFQRKTHHLTRFERPHLVWRLQDHVYCRPPLGNYTLYISSAH